MFLLKNVGLSANSFVNFRKVGVYGTKPLARFASGFCRLSKNVMPITFLFTLPSTGGSFLRGGGSGIACPGFPCTFSGGFF